MSQRRSRFEDGFGAASRDDRWRPSEPPVDPAEELGLVHVSTYTHTQAEKATCFHWDGSWMQSPEARHLGRDVDEAMEGLRRGERDREDDERRRERKKAKKRKHRSGERDERDKIVSSSPDSDDTKRSHKKKHKHKVGTHT